MTAASAARAASPASARPSAWQRSLAVLGAAAILLVLLFRRDALDVATIWWTNTTFGHCLFIAPVVAWLVWQRRQVLAELAPVAWWPGLALVAAGGFGWLIGDAAGVHLVRQLGLVTMLDGAVVTLLGPHVARVLLFPLAYAYFMVPFGEGLEPPLQAATVRMVMPMLHAFGVPAAVDGVLITIPNGWFEVAEACSGAKFVIAMIAYGALVANVCFLSWRRRAAFMALAVIVPVLANAVRAFGTIYAAWWTSVEAATGYDHIVFGWVFFGLVMAATLAIAWPWFDRAPDQPVASAGALPPIRRGRIDTLLAAMLVLAVASLFPWWSGTTASRAAPLPAQVTLPDVPGWHRVALSERAAWTPYYPGADHFLIGCYQDAAGDAVDLAVAVYREQHEGHELVAFGVGPLRQNDRWLRVADLPPLDGGSAMRITAPGANGAAVERQVVTWYRIGGVTTASPIRVKAETLRARLIGGQQRAVALHLSAEVAPGHDPRLAIGRFLAAAGPIDRLANTISPGRE